MQECSFLAENMFSQNDYSTQSFPRLASVHSLAWIRTIIYPWWLLKMNKMYFIPVLNHTQHTTSGAYLLKICKNSFSMYSIFENLLSWNSLQYILTHSFYFWYSIVYMMINIDTFCSLSLQQNRPPWVINQESFSGHFRDR